VEFREFIGDALSAQRDSHSELLGSQPSEMTLDF